MEQIGFARTDVRVGEWTVDFERFGLNPFAILVVKALLRDFANVDFRIEVCGKGFVVIARIAIHDVEIVDFIKIMLGSVSRVNARHAWVETTTENGCEASLFETLSVSPLP